MAGFCMGTCLKLYGKCEECILKRIGKGKDGKGLPSSRSCEQVVIITHQPIGNRPRLVSDHDLFASVAPPTVTTQTQTPAPTASSSTSSANSKMVSSSQQSSQLQVKQPEQAQSRSASFRWKRRNYGEPTSTSSKKEQKPMLAAANDDDDADASSPMLTRSEQVQPPLGSTTIGSEAATATSIKVPVATVNNNKKTSDGSSGDEAATLTPGSDAGHDFDYCQSLRFAMLYQPGNARLQVTVKSFCILPPHLTAGCYVVVSLVSGADEKLVSTFKTSIKQKTKIPEWEETFVLDAVQRPAREGEWLIRLEVVAFDQFSHEVCIGRLKVDVASLKDCITQEFFRSLDEDRERQLDSQSSLLECSLLVGLFYHHTTQTLVLDMIKVKELTALAAQLTTGSSGSTSSTGSTGTGAGTTLAPAQSGANLIGINNNLKHMAYFIRARIYDANALIKERRTNERKVTEEVMNESLTFNLDRRNIRNITAEFTLFVRSRKDERQVGWFSLGAITSGSAEKEHWSNMLRSHASPVVQWMLFKQPSSPSCSPMLTE